MPRVNPAIPKMFTHILLSTTGSNLSFDPLNGSTQCSPPASLYVRLAGFHGCILPL